MIKYIFLVIILMLVIYYLFNDKKFGIINFYDKNNLDKQIDIYNGWRRSNFTDCNCEAEKSRKLIDDDFPDDLTKLKGVCLKIKPRKTLNI